MANYICMAWRRAITTIPALIDFIEKATNSTIYPLLLRVEERMNSTDERWLKEDPPYLSDEEYNMLKQYQNPRQKRS